MSQSEKLDAAYEVLRLPKGVSLKAVRRRRRAMVKLLTGERLSEMEDSFKTLLRHFTGGDHDGTPGCLCQPDRASYSATPFQGKQRKGFDRRTAIEEAIFQQAESQGQIWRWRVAIVYGVVFLIASAWGWRQHIAHPHSEWLRPRTLEELRPRAGSGRLSPGPLEEIDKQNPGAGGGASPEVSPGAAPDQAPRREPIDLRSLPPELITPEMTAIQNSIIARQRSIDNVNQQLSYLRKQKFIATPETASALDAEMARLLAARLRLVSAIEQDQDRLYDLMKAATDDAVGEQEGDESGETGETGETDADSE